MHLTHSTNAELAITLRFIRSIQAGIIAELSRRQTARRQRRYSGTAGTISENLGNVGPVSDPLCDGTDRQWTF